MHLSALQNNLCLPSKCSDFLPILTRFHRLCCFLLFILFYNFNGALSPFSQTCTHHPCISSSNNVYFMEKFGATRRWVYASVWISRRTAQYSFPLWANPLNQWRAIRHRWISHRPLAFRQQQQGSGPRQSDTIHALRVHPRPLWLSESQQGTYWSA